MREACSSEARILTSVGAPRSIETKVRATDCAALELFLAHVEGTPPDDHLRVPESPADRLRLAEAMVRLGWCRAETARNSA
jgi:hypothetical protein